MANKVLRGAIATTSIKEKTLPPILRWAGGKRKHKWLFEAIKQVFNPNKHRLIEPFAGGLAIALGVDPKWALLNDANEYLVDFYRLVKRGISEERASLVANTLTDESTYYAVRRDFNRFHHPLDFYYLNRTGYNGLCRFNQSGDYNNPYGKLKNPKLDHNFEAYRDRFQDWVFTCMDFELIKVFPNDIVVSDPPYDVLKGKDDHDYITGGFDWVDQVRHADWLASLKNPVFACNLATDRIIDLYTTKGFDIQYVEAPRAIACNGDRAKVREILATKNLGVAP